MKMIHFNFNRETGESIVILQNRNGRYIGKAKLNPDDEKYASEIAGCYLAERRAWIQYYKKEISRLKTKLKAIEGIEKDLQNNYSNYWFEPTLQERFSIIKKYYKEQIEECKFKIEEINYHITKSSIIRENLIKRNKDNERENN